MVLEAMVPGGTVHRAAYCAAEIEYLTARDGGAAHGPALRLAMRAYRRAWLAADAAGLSHGSGPALIGVVLREVWEHAVACGEADRAGLPRPSEATAYNWGSR